MGATKKTKKNTSNEVPLSKVREWLLDETNFINAIEKMLEAPTRIYKVVI